MPRLTRGERNIVWIRDHCIDRGRLVRLTPEQRATIYQLYDAPAGVQPQEPITGQLAAWPTLLHLVGVEARRGSSSAAVAGDGFLLALVQRGPRAAALSHTTSTSE